MFYLLLLKGGNNFDPVAALFGVNETFAIDLNGPLLFRSLGLIYSAQYGNTVIISYAQENTPTDICSLH